MPVFCYGLPFNLRSMRSASASTEADVGHAEVCKDHKGFMHSIELGSMLRWKSWPHIRPWSVDGFNIAGTFQTQRQIETERERELSAASLGLLITSTPPFPSDHDYTVMCTGFLCERVESSVAHFTVSSSVERLWQMWTSDSPVFIRWFRTLHLLPLP